MSRRDTIIVAVLVNAALLMVLFATAVRSDDAQPKAEKNPVQLAKTPVEVEEDLLDHFVTAVPTLVEEDEIPIAFTEDVPLTFAAPEPVKEKEEAKFVDVTVKNGDFLERIAKANNTSVAAIRKANNLTSDQLKIGQVLKIPLVEGAVAAPAAAAEEFYVVQDGDSPWVIAKRNNLALDDLLRLNNLDEQKARRLRPGDRLKIR